MFTSIIDSAGNLYCRSCFSDEHAPPSLPLENQHRLKNRNPLKNGHGRHHGINGHKHKRHNGRRPVRSITVWIRQGLVVLSICRLESARAFLELGGHCPPAFAAGFLDVPMAPVAWILRMSRVIRIIRRFYEPVSVVPLSG